MSTVLDDFTAGALQGATVTLHTRMLPPMRLDLDGPPSPLTAALQPALVVERNGQRVASWSPHGVPSPVWPSVLLVLGFLLVLGIAALL